MTKQEEFTLIEIREVERQLINENLPSPLFKKKLSQLMHLTRKFLGTQNILNDEINLN